MEYVYNCHHLRHVFHLRKSFKGAVIPLFVLFLSVLGGLTPAYADLGTARASGPPYLPTTCYGSNPAQFPAGNLFAYATDRLWDNGAACGRLYNIRCLSPSSCINGTTVTVRIVGYKRSNADALILSKEAMRRINRRPNKRVFIDFSAK